MRQPVIAVAGVKNSGKTTLVEKLVRSLVAKGYRVATIKHDAHGFEPDVPGRDSHRHRAAGAYGSAVFDRDKFMLVKDGAQTIEGLLGAFPEADIVLLEGARDTDYPKIEVVRAGNSVAPRCDPRTLLALATDLPLQVPGVPVYGMDDVEGLTCVVLSFREKMRKETGTD